MDVAHLRALVATAELRSATEAARLLAYSLSGLSRQLQTLEAELGVDLFARAGGGLVPTPSAVELLPLATSIVALSDAMSATADRHRTARQARPARPPQSAVPRAAGAPRRAGPPLTPTQRARRPG